MMKVLCCPFRSFLVLTTLLLFFQSPARADDFDLMAPASRSLWASVVLGPALNTSQTPTQFKLAQTFGYHFSGAATGQGLAFDLQEAFGNHFTTLGFVPRFVWDFQIVHSLGLYLTTNIGMGLMLQINENATNPGLTFQFGLDGKLVFKNQWMLIFRPFGFDIHPIVANDEWHTGIRYELMVGGGVIF